MMGPVDLLLLLAVLGAWLSFAGVLVWVVVRSRNAGLLWLRLYFLVGAAWAMAGANWLAHAGLALVLGGTARNGHIVGDHYYLGNHGQYREVSELLYRFMDRYGEWSDRVAMGATVALLMVYALVTALSGRLTPRRPSAPAPGAPGAGAPGAGGGIGAGGGHR